MRREVARAYSSNPDVDAEWPVFEDSSSDWDTSDDGRSVFFDESDEEQTENRLAMERSLIRHGGRTLRDPW